MIVATLLGDVQLSRGGVISALARKKYFIARRASVIGSAARFIAPLFFVSTHALRHLFARRAAYIT